MESQAWFAAQLSIWVACVSTLIVAALGIFIAYIFAKKNFAAKNILDILITLPLVLPPTVTGYYLIVLLGRSGWIGGPLYDLTGWTVTFTWWAAVIASTVVSLPFMVRTGRAAIESVDPNVEHASQLLGKGEWYTAIRITLPLARRGLIAGLVLSFARAMGEFGATLMLAGNIPGRTQTVAVAIYDAVESGDGATARILVLVISATALVILTLANRLTPESGPRT